MKLLLFLISLSSFSIFGIKCNTDAQEADLQNESDTLKVITDTLPASIDSVTAKMSGDTSTSIDTKADTASKETKYGTSTGKHEAPKHGIPNQEKVDSIKEAKKKKKKD